MASYNVDEFDEHYLLELARVLHRMWEESGGTGTEGLMFQNLLVQNKAKNPPASKQFLCNLKAVSKCNGKCSICLGEFQRSQLVKELPECGHYYHADCIIRWLEQTNTCPMCRCEYPTDDVEYEEKRRLKLKEKDKEERMEDLHNSMFS